MTLAELQRSGRTDQLELTRFGRDELAAQLTGILGHPPEYAVVEEILRRSDGNPFLAAELLAAASEVPGQTPTRVRDIVMARFETLSEPTQRMLGVLSAAPRSMTHHDLATVADMSEHDLEGALREALARSVLVRTGNDAYAFRHGLTREATDDGLLVRERRRLHLALARALDTARTAGADPPSQLLADRAHHWYHAGDQRRALQSAVEAAAAAEEVYAHAEALTQYERALELWDRVEDPAQLAGRDCPLHAPWQGSSPSASGALRLPCSGTGRASPRHRLVSTTARTSSSMPDPASPRDTRASPPDSHRAGR